MVKNDEERPILERISTIVPPMEEITQALRQEQVDANKINVLMLAGHALLVELGEIINQALSDSIDLASKENLFIDRQADNLKEAERIARKNANARSLIMGQDVFWRSDIPSVAHILRIVDLSTVEKAGEYLGDKIRVLALIDALKKSIEE